jgi:hypothetical protein
MAPAMQPAQVDCSATLTLRRTDTMNFGCGGQATCDGEFLAVYGLGRTLRSSG